ncbi:MAG: DUF2203 domain-containing protein [Anaerolineales bacterium]|jgi:hypothetical protein
MTAFPYFQRYFTKQQANQLLELLNPLVKEMMQAAEVLLSHHPEMAPMLDKAINNGGIRKPGPALEASLKVQDLATQIKGYDVLIKDVRHGLIDFPSRRADRIVLLCWRYGEPEVAFWHEIDGGFAGRQPL